jgi:hypothetical protein
VLGISLFGVAFAGDTNERLTLNGMGFTVPKGYVKSTAAARENSVFLYDQKNKDGIVVAVPAKPFVEQDVLNSLMKDSQKAFFPKETQAYQWKSADSLQKVSKFEVKDSLVKGLNPNHLLLFEYRHVVFNERDVFVGTIYEARRGKPAKAMFDGEGAAMSMTTCSAAVELIYSFTGEKINPDRPPCELIANVP